MADGTQRVARIVVAEDDAEMRRLVVEALRKDGHEVIEAADGAHLLVEVVSKAHRAESPPVDLIVSDIRMPAASGLDVVIALREAHCATKVILMTAFGDDDTRARAEALGARLFDKPFALKDLRRAVIAMLAA